MATMQGENMKYQVMPDLTPIEYEALKADIEERGVLVPVEVDEAGAILDGHHRVKAWAELRSEGVNLPDYPRMVRRGLTEEQKRNHARSLNVLRRHLSREQRDEVMRAMRADGMTYQEIADRVGVNVATAHRAAADVELLHLQKLTGADGKARPASYAPRTFANDTPALFVPGGAVTLEPSPLGNGPVIHLNNGVKQCATCKQMWSADLPYCPYCNISPEARMAYVQQERQTLRPAAANHAVSDDPDYDGDEWYTPADYIGAARLVLGSIDLDPASCDAAQETVQAEAYYTKHDNGLTMPWFGNVWLNPPYSATLIRLFVAKLIDEHDKGNVTAAVVLTNNSSDTGWFHDLLSRYPACFTRGRVQFWRPNHEDFGARQGQTLFYLGDNVDLFKQVFGRFGQVVGKL